MQDIGQKPGYEEAAMSTEKENTDKIKNSVTTKEGVKNHRKVAWIVKFFNSHLVR